MSLPIFLNFFDERVVALDKACLDPVYMCVGVRWAVKRSVEGTTNYSIRRIIYGRGERVRARKEGKKSLEHRQ
jgi:hypothetical protein